MTPPLLRLRFSAQLGALSLRFATRGFASANAAPLPTWNRLIRFEPAGAAPGTWVYGEPTTLEKDGSLPIDASNVKARVVKPGPSGDVFGAECRVTDEVVSVGKVGSIWLFSARIPLKMS